LSESYRGSLLPLFFGALAAAADFLITGGIHYDGFCDTTDALSSHQSREKKLEIMKDPHCGAFAVVSCLIVLVLKISAYALIFQTGFEAVLVLCFGAVASRIFAAAALIVIPKAATSSLAKTFGRAADRTDLFFLFLLLLLSAFTLMICTGYVIMILIALLSAILLFFSLKKMCRKDFGGLTGDHAGYFIVRAETIWALSVACTELLLPAIEKTFI
jgi:adenosylcobinamide-GDP ribazoletransferase